MEEMAVQGAQSVGRDPLAEGRSSAGEQSAPVYKFVLTGGPCAGKTTALLKMSDYFRGKG